MSDFGDFIDFELLPQQARRQILVEGKDSERFVQGMVTADVRALPAGSARPAALLTVKGKIISDAVLIRVSPQAIALWVPAALQDTLVAKLQKHAIMDEVEISADAQLRLWWSSQAGDPASSISTTYPLQGYLHTTNLEALPTAKTPLTVEQWMLRRCEQHVAAWGFEIAEDAFPPEVGFVDAVSYDKGCYLGQEPLARLHARGQVNWLIVPVQGEGGCPSLQDAALSHEARPEAGKLTSVAAQGDRWIGLAQLHRKASDVGSQLSFVALAGRSATVSGAPIGADSHKK